MQQLTNISFALPGGKFVALAGNGKQYPLPGGSFLSEEGVYRYTFVITIAAYFSWWARSA